MSQSTFKTAISSGDNDGGVGRFVFSGSLGGVISASLTTDFVWTLSEEPFLLFSFLMSFN